MHLKKKKILGTVLLVDEPVPKVEKRLTRTVQRRRCQLHMAYYHTKTEKGNAPKSTEQYQSCGISLCGDYSMPVCHGCLQ